MFGCKSKQTKKILIYLSKAYCKLITLKQF